MGDEIKGKAVSDSRVTLSQVMQPEMANTQGNVHGGWIMKLVDEAGALACIRHSRQRVVTVAVDQLTFDHPILIGNLVVLEAEVSWVGRTSMEAEVNVFAENLRKEQRWHTNTAYVVYVALDDNERPTEVPPLIPETEAHKIRMNQAEERQAYRLRQRKQKLERDIMP
ncbi:acyl-CoA thioesterase [Chloroflexota bacterium]